MPRFSVVIVTYNYRQYVAEAIDAALKQELPPEEVIVVDDGSSDGTADYLREYYGLEPKVRLIATANRGQLAAVRTGAEAASGEVIAFKDADDVWEPGYLAALAKVYDTRPEVDFVYTNMRYFGSREGLHQPDTADRDLGYSILLGAFHTQYQGTATSALSARRELALRTLTLPEPLAVQFRTGADDCLVVGTDVLGARKVYLGQPLVRYRAHAASDSLKRKREATERYRHWLRAQSLILHYRQQAGLAREHLQAVKQEFLTKPQPTRKDLRDYGALLAKSDLPFGKRLEQRLALWRHWWRCRGTR